MFTGIVESIGKVISIRKNKSNFEIGIECFFAKELKKGQSVAHNGVCLTVETISKKNYTVTAIKETLSKTNLGKLKVGDEVNLERSLKVGDRLDGHFVQGHVDCTAFVRSIRKEKGSWLFEFGADSSATRNLIINKGSICINGVSLTIASTQRNNFSVAIIPYTFTHTNFSSLKKGRIVNVEFDILGKHINKIISNK